MDQPPTAGMGDETAVVGDSRQQISPAKTISNVCITLNTERGWHRCHPRSIRLFDYVSGEDSLVNSPLTAADASSRPSLEAKTVVTKLNILLAAV